MFRVSYGSKYGNIRAEHNGIQYHSKKEAAYAAGLDLRVKAGDIKSWERQIKISFDINGFHICNYYCDFLIHHNDDSDEYIEIKGKFLLNMDVFRIKRKLMEAIFLVEHPNARYTIIT